MTAETIKLYVRAVINRVPRLAAEVIGNEWPQHSHSIHSDLDADDHLHYMLCAGGAARPFTGDVYWSEDTALWGAVELRFGDHFFDLYQAAYPDNWTEHGIALAKSQAEVSDFFDRFGTSSILSAFSTAYDLGGGGSGTFSYLARDGGTHWTDYGILYGGTGIALADGAHGVSIALSHLGLQSLTDPGADHIFFWDDSSNAAAWLTLGTNLSITGTTLNAAGYTGGSFNHDDLLNRGNDGAHNQYILVSGTRAFTGNQSMGTNDLTNIGTLSGATTLGLSNSYFAASDWVGDMPLASSSAEIDTLRGFADGEVSLFGALNLGITAITDDNGSTQVKGAPLAIYAGNALLITKVEGQPGFLDGFRIDYDPEGLLIEPASINTAIGTETGDVDDIKVISDGDVYHVDETTGNPAIIVNIGWADVTSFDRVILRAWYHGAAPLHTIHVQLQNHTTVDYDEIATLTLKETYQLISVAITNPSDYIIDGAVTLRLIHDETGSTAHDLDIDYAALAIGGGGALVSMQAAYDGGKTITMASGNAGPVIINSGTEASPCLSIAQTQAAFSSYVGSIGNASTSGDSVSLLFSGAAGGDQSTAFQIGHRIWTEGCISIGRQNAADFTAYFSATNGEVTNPDRRPVVARMASESFDDIGGGHTAFSYVETISDGVDGGLASSWATVHGWDYSIVESEYGPVYLDPATYTSLSSKPVRNATDITYGNFGSPSISLGVATVGWPTNKQLQDLDFSANITNVKMTPPVGSSTNYLQLNNTDSSAHTVTNFTKSDGTTPCVSWGDVDPDAGAISVPAGGYALFTLIYNLAKDSYTGWCEVRG